MNGRTRGTLTLLLLSIPLLGAVAPAVAGETPANDAGFDLQLETVLPPEALALGSELSTHETGAPAIAGTDAAEAAMVAEVRIAAALPLDPRLSGAAEASAWSAENDAVASSAAGSKKKGFGRWLRKHWWAPSLVAVAVGVLLLEPFDDDKVDDKN